MSTLEGTDRLPDKAEQLVKPNVFGMSSFYAAGDELRTKFVAEEDRYLYTEILYKMTFEYPP